MAAILSEGDELILKEVVLYIHFRADSSVEPSQWETSLQGNAISHWPGTNLEPAQHLGPQIGHHDP